MSQETPCPRCGGSIETSNHPTRIRRGSQVLATTRTVFRCESCRDVDTGEPFTFGTMASMRADAQRHQVEWRERFAAEMPDSGRPGPKTKQESRRRIVPIRFSDDELEALDRKRGALSRSDYVRKVLDTAAGGG